MGDIVERLREQPTMSSFANIGDMVGRLNHEREEAADEIERLRDALAPFGCTCIEDYCQYQQFDGGSETCPHNIARAALGEEE